LAVKAPSNTSARVLSGTGGEAGGVDKADELFDIFSVSGERRREERRTQKPGKGFNPI
jgi:hypothetical protein